MVRFVALLIMGLTLLVAPAAEAAGVAQIRLFGYSRSDHAITLYSSAPLQTKGFHLKAPERWVVDIPNARYKGGTVTLPAIAGTPIRGVRIAQFKGGTVRLVFDLEHWAEFPQERVFLGGRGHRLAFKVRPEGQVRNPAPLPGLAPPVRVPSPEPTSVQRPSADPVPAPAGAGLVLHRVRGGWELIVTAESPFSYSAPAKSRTSRLVFDVQGAGSELPRDSLYVDNGLIARVRVVALSAKAHRIIVEFDQAIECRVFQSSDRKSLTLALGEAAGAEPGVHRDPNEKRVTIDPGHGGIDPGAIGRRGTLEKDVTLQMALRLQKLMLNSGIEVQMTRTKDMHIKLHPRVDVGDSFNSDVFISIHANHVRNPRVSGIETYYFTPKSLPLARAVHKRLVAKLNRPDRGIRRNNFVVVKYNKMPACLVEVGYLSNPTEERLLTNPAYQQKAAEAIMAGVQDYFKQRAIKQ